MTEKKNNYFTPIIAGILIMIFFIAFQQLFPIQEDAKRLIQGTLSIILRVFAAFWISTLTKQQGRKSLPFVIIGIIIPAITLIIVGIIGDKKKKAVANKVDIFA